MKKWLTEYPPYNGDEPYIYFAFAEADTAKVENIIHILLNRGCRIYYIYGTAGSAQELLYRQKRASEAALTILYLSDALCADTDSKTNILVNQKYRRPIICLNPDGKERRFVMGIRDEVPVVSLKELAHAGNLESELVHTKGFTQELMGEPVEIKKSSSLYKWSLILCGLAVLVLIGTLIGVKYLNWFQYEKENLDQTIISDEIDNQDDVEFSDSVIRDAVRCETSDGIITYEVVENLTTLRLHDVPDSWDELSKLPSLESIEILQKALLSGEKLPDKKYTIVLIVGDET